ncbi:hypothetical protein BDK51DRAFT_49162 [Blyttiomyces helicus]|uniref:Uncharacterized protein n=1 Tax=Blyttiomyces helicus TaxID=388810 RepID=A0A4P9WA80_9FUNG|nr:hypothetical protein BDK51DRAFT_49162 [Blyttiomyces helicus]|eukprot:RKO89334.1 hypothetical protein BDK51DRAFT_49162 [Blyttiomyces helicus]
MAVLREHILNGKLRRPIQRALDTLDVDALTLIADVCPNGRLTRLRWSYLGEDGYFALFEIHDGLDIGEEEDSDDESGTWREPPVLVAVYRNRWDAVRLLVEAGFSTNRAVNIAVLSRAHHENIRYLFSLNNKEVATEWAIGEAAHRDDVPLLRLLHAHRVGGIRPSVMHTAAHTGQLDMVACLLEIGAPYLTRFTADLPGYFAIGDTAALGGHLSLIQFFHEKALPDIFSPRAMALAAKHSLDVVRYLHEHCTEICTTDAMDTAAAFGQLISSASFTSTAQKVAPLMAWTPPQRLESLTFSASFTSTAPRGELPTLWTTPQHLGDWTLSGFFTITALKGARPVRWITPSMCGHIPAVGRGGKVLHYRLFLVSSSHRGLHRGRYQRCVQGWIRRDGSGPPCRQLCDRLSPGARSRRRQAGRGDPRVLYEAGKRLLDEELERFLGETEGDVRAFLDEMHGTPQRLFASFVCSTARLANPSHNTFDPLVMDDCEEGLKRRALGEVVQERRWHASCANMGAREEWDPGEDGAKFRHKVLPRLPASRPLLLHVPCSPHPAVDLKLTEGSGTPPNLTGAKWERVKTVAAVVALGRFLANNGHSRRPRPRGRATFKFRFDQHGNRKARWVKTFIFKPSASTDSAETTSSPPPQLPTPCTPASYPMPSSRPLPNELADRILELLTVSLRRKAVLRKHILKGKLQRQIQRALDLLDLDALRFVAAVCPKWRSTKARWMCCYEDPPLIENDEAAEEAEEAISVEQEVEDVGEGVEEEDEDVGDGDVEEDEVGDGGDEEDGDVGGDEEEGSWHVWGECVRRGIPVLVAISRDRWDVVRFLIEAVFSSDTLLMSRRLPQRRSARQHPLPLLSLGHVGAASSHATISPSTKMKFPSYASSMPMVLPSRATYLSGKPSDGSAGHGRLPLGNRCPVSDAGPSRPSNNRGHCCGVRVALGGPVPPRNRAPEHMHPDGMDTAPGMLGSLDIV